MHLCVGRLTLASRNFVPPVRRSEVAQRKEDGGLEGSGNVRMSGELEGRWEAAEADLEGRLLGLPLAADREVACLTPSGSAP